MDKVRAYFNEHHTLDEALGLYVLAEAPLEELGAFSREVTLKYAPRKFDLCSICNVKSGRCSENCKWCAQSACFKAQIESHGVLLPGECVSQALNQASYGVHRFSLVSSGRAPRPLEFGKLLGNLRALSAVTPLKLCVSLGLLDAGQLAQLKAAGVTRIHCNIETSPSFFPKMCTTHTIEDKFKTIKAAKKLGLEVCSGGIIGLGESYEDRVEFAQTLHKLDIRSIPLNILHPIKGTPLEHNALVTPEDILRMTALLRLTLPESYVRFAGGRAQYDEELTRRALYFGVNSSIVGNLLTTQGCEIENDLKAFKEAGYELD